VTAGGRRNGEARRAGRRLLRFDSPQRRRAAGAPI